MWSAYIILLCSLVLILPLYFFSSRRKSKIRFINPDLQKDRLKNNTEQSRNNAGGPNESSNLGRFSEGPANSKQGATFGESKNLEELPKKFSSENIAIKTPESILNEPNERYPIETIDSLLIKKNRGTPLEKIEAIQIEPTKKILIPAENKTMMAAEKIPKPSPKTNNMRTRDLNRTDTHEPILGKPGNTYSNSMGNYDNLVQVSKGQLKLANEKIYFIVKSYNNVISKFMKYFSCETEKQKAFEKSALGFIIENAAIQLENCSKTFPKEYQKELQNLQILMKNDFSKFQESYGINSCCELSENVKNFKKCLNSKSIVFSQRTDVFAVNPNSLLESLQIMQNSYHETDMKRAEISNYNGIVIPEFVKYRSQKLSDSNLL